MKKNILFLLFMAMLSAVSGLLMSKMSFIGRVGINLMHKEYKFLKVWWQGALAVFAALLLLFIVHAIVQKVFPIMLARFIHFVLLLAAIGGLYLTYSDFEDDFSHHLLRNNFHLGAYLFWGAWMLMCIFFMTKKAPVEIADRPDARP